MKPFPAHVKEWRIDTHRDAPYGGLPKVKWVKIVLQVPTSSWKVARSIGARLGRHMRRQQPRYVTVGEDLIDAAAERDQAYEWLRAWQDWSTRMHRRLGFIGKLEAPDDTKGRQRLTRVILANTKGCRMGVYCSEHNFVHGAEAEDLRDRLEKLIATADRSRRDVATWELQNLIDECDARDSLAFCEIQKDAEEDDDD
jgi:hypothetical protein